MELKIIVLSALLKITAARVSNRRQQPTSRDFFKKIIFSRREFKVLLKIK
jgi:hypothetical protein